MRKIIIDLKKAAALILSLAMVVTFIPLCTFQSNAEDGEIEMPQEYKALINEIYTAVNNGFDSIENYTHEDVEASSLSPAAKEFFDNKLLDAGRGGAEIDELYYALLDMNNDGTPELLVKSVEGDGEYDSLEVLYTIENGHVVVITSYAYRNQARVAGKMIYNYGASSAFEHVDSIYSLGSNNELEYEIGYVTRYESEDSFVIAEIDEKGNQTGRFITEEELASILGDYLAADAPDWTCLDLNGGVDPGPAPDPDYDEVVLPYKDVKAGDWFEDDVKYAYFYKLMNGVEENKFDPEGTTSRAMIVTILYRIEGEPAFMNDSKFKDVEKGSYYEKAVAWASGKGIVTGTTTTKFSPNDPITREQFAAILYRYAKFIDVDVSVGKDTDMKAFKDFSKRSDYAEDALKWAFTEGLITGVTEKTIEPLGKATRAQAAAIFHRFCESDFPMAEIVETDDHR